MSFTVELKGGQRELLDNETLQSLGLARFKDIELTQARAQRLRDSGTALIAQVKTRALKESLSRDRQIKRMAKELSDDSGAEQ